VARQRGGGDGWRNPGRAGMLAGMSKEDFPVTALLISLAATLAMAAVRQADWKHKALIWSLLGIAAVSGASA
jgi:hypothetical protein